MPGMRVTGNIVTGFAGGGAASADYGRIRLNKRVVRLWADPR